MEHKAEHLQSVKVEALDAILGEPFKILNDGFIRVIDYMGNDTAIVQAARVSYGAGTKQVLRDKELIRYLLRHEHTSPFEMCEIKLHIRVPMDCWRQWIRHRTANVNEYSTRYSVAIDSSQTTLPGSWRMQAANNKQGSAGFMDTSQGQLMTDRETELHNLATSIYNERIEAGVAREQARKDLPLCTYTEAYWKIDLKNLLHFLWLRMDSHAQAEIRSYATLIGEQILAKWCPLTWEAFKDYKMAAIKLSVQEQSLIASLLQNNNEAASEKAKSMGWLETKDDKLRFHLERFEFENKLMQMGIKAPWKKA
ncbi:FAD-dependent thymidylate synthase [bacterium]|nr:FAD-dependent thymidylate synthase [bacterium]